MLRELDLLPVYDSAEQHIVRELIVPLLENSNSYIRGVGYFTSGWLRVAARGLVPFARHGGRARFIVSPILSPKDLGALEQGAKARADHVLREALGRALTTLEDDIETHTLNVLAWMVADGILDFRIAIPRPAYRHGDYHDKVGVFSDEASDQVAFHGSLNDTERGSLNGESFSVFQSWIAGQSEYVTIHQARLEKLWEDGNAQFSIHEVPEAVRGGLLKLRSAERPYGQPQVSQVPATSTSPSAQLRAPHPLRDYQEEAIHCWEQAGGRGILEMATGTGKTYTSLGAVLSRHRQLGRLAVVIEVPYIHLVDQWQRACTEFGMRPVACSSAHGRWQLRAAEAVEWFRSGVRPSVCILAVHQTAASEKFRRLLHGLPMDQTMLIADEVHALGATHLQDAMLDQANMRLGLSATPDRWFDAEGTSSLHDYFGGVCYQFPLDRAIDEAFLVPYDYEPHLCALDEEETAEYARLSNAIRSVLSGSDAADPREDAQLSNLLIRRARLVGQASSKLPVLVDLLRQMQEQGEVRHVLVYCAPGSHEEVLQAVSSLGLRCHEFTHRVNAQKRQAVLDHFATGDIQVLVAVRCLDEGVDVPATRTAFVLASTTNPRQFVQRRGRVLRKHPGKNRAVVHDFLVVGGSGYEDMPELEVSLLRREMPRFAEFARDALNEFTAREVVWEILDERGMLHLMDKTPWEIYGELTADERDGVDDLGGT